MKHICLKTIGMNTTGTSFEEHNVGSPKYFERVSLNLSFILCVEVRIMSSVYALIHVYLLYAWIAKKSRSSPNYRAITWSVLYGLHCMEYIV